MTTLQIFTQIMLYAVCLKVIIGFHFPWEKCACCSKRWGDHTWTVRDGVTVKKGDDDARN